MNKMIKKSITKSDITKTSITIIEYLIDNEYVTEFEDENKWDFHLQDIIDEEINNLINN